MWASVTPKTIDKKSNTVLTLEKYITNARQHFMKQREDIPKLRHEAQRLRHEAQTLTQRFQLRMRKDQLAKAIQLENEADIREGMQREHAYEQMIGPYLAAYNKKVDMPEAQENRNITAPGGGKQRETIDSYIQQHDATALRQNTVISEYLMESNEAPKVVLNTRDTCPLCHKDMMLLNSKALMICQSCGYSMAYLDATMTSMSYSDDIEFSTFSYKRINHFNEWLQQVQGKESYEIPEDVLPAVMRELQRQRIVNVKDINAKKVREVLKTLKLRKAYEHVAQITARLTGINPPRVPSEIEEQCRLMFIAVQPVFEKHCPQDRKNFLSYSYCLYKFFELLGYEHFLDSFTLLKGRDKLAKQDEIFKKICADLSWEFVPSV